MILGIEIALIVVAIYGLIKGRLPITRARVVEGTPARLLALLGLVPVPLTLLITMLVLGVKAAKDGHIDEKSAGMTGTIVEVVVVLGTLLIFFALGFTLATEPRQKSSEDWDDRPRRSRKARDHDEDDDEAPRRKRPRRDDEDDYDRGDEHIKAKN